jgi:2-polyprenyl-3-methyl-5-hydroxy-6-metoxy-1,4-benzoquinol methylase
MTSYTCVACQSTDWFGIFQMGDVPVHCNVLWPTAEKARCAQRGDIRLVCCRNCGMIYNRAFDETLLQYGEGYENSLHYSPSFQQYATTLADGLVQKYHLVDKDIIEIGCGGGEFLSLLCQEASNRGVGFDPSYPTAQETPQQPAGIHIIRDFYSPKYKAQQADLICCRHVLEHIPTPNKFLSNVREAIGDRTDTIVFFEVPNSLYSLRDMGIWDIIYEHCSYFTESSLARIFLKAGFDILDIRETFGKQFLAIEAKLASQTSNLSCEETSSIGEVVDLALSFGEKFRKKAEIWKRNLEYGAKEGKRMVIWGAGSKGVTFLNAVKAETKIEYVVDLNPHKQHKFVPGTGQEVISPDALKAIKPDVILVMNPIYLEEISGMLKERNLASELVCV